MSLLLGKRINPNLKIDGMLLTLVDSRTNLAKSTVEALRENFGNQIKMYRTYIPIAVKAAETSSKGKSIFAYEPNSTVSKAYTEFTKEVLADGRKKERLVSLAGVYSPKQKIEDSKVPVTLGRLLEKDKTIRRIVLHLDNDIAGRKATKALQTILSDKYEVVDDPPQYGKDVNDFLCKRLDDTIPLENTTSLSIIGFH